MISLKPNSSLSTTWPTRHLANPALLNDFTKSVPKGPAKVAMAIMSLMLPDISDQVGEDRCPTAQFKKVKHNLLQKYDQVVDIQNPEGFGARSGEFIGEMLALGSVGKVIRVADGVSVFGMACEGGFVGGVVAEAHDTNKLAGVALGFAGGAGTGKILKLLFKTPIPKPLPTRTLTVRPELFSQEIRAIEAMQQPFYRGGFVTDKTAMKLAERSISKIKPQKQLTSVRSQVALNKKFNALQDAQKEAVKIRHLKDGRIRYYDPERASKTKGPTRGSSYVTEYNPKIGQVRSWNECYDWYGNVNRVHPKMIDGQQLVGQHYPLTQNEMEMYLK